MYRVLVDNWSANILFKDVIIQICVDPSNLTSMIILLIQIEEKGVLVGVLDLIVTIDTYLNCQTLQ